MTGFHPGQFNVKPRLILQMKPENSDKKTQQ